jgi:hypothetical protein
MLGGFFLDANVFTMLGDLTTNSIVPSISNKHGPKTVERNTTRGGQLRCTCAGSAAHKVWLAPNGSGSGLEVAIEQNAVPATSENKVNSQNTLVAVSPKRCADPSPHIHAGTNVEQEKTTQLAYVQAAVLQSQTNGLQERRCSGRHDGGAGAEGLDGDERKASSRM